MLNPTEISPAPQIVANREHLIGKLKQQLFIVEVSDQRAACGQVIVDMAPIEGAVDDILRVCVEAAFLPGTTTATQAVGLKIGDDEDNTLTIFKMAGRLLIESQGPSELVPVTPVVDTPHETYSASVEGFDDDIQFLAPVGATQEQVQSALVDALAQHARIEIRKEAAAC